MAKAYYATKISPHRGKTEEGYLICPAVPVARTGFQFYGANELDYKPSDDIKKENGGYNVFRSEEEVFSEETLSSLEGKPITDDHPSEVVTSDNYNIYAKGNVKEARRGEGEYKDFILADLVVWDKDLIRKIKNGKQGVSVGYSCNYDEREGKLCQKDIICNHVAVVDEGRAGDRAIIRDNNTKEEPDMAEEIKKEEEIKENMDESKKDECKKDECKAKDSIDLEEIIAKIEDHERRLGTVEKIISEKEKDVFDELEEEIFKEKKETCDEDAEVEKITEKETVGDSALRNFIRQVKPHVAKITDAKERKTLSSLMCEAIKANFVNDSKKESKKSVYAGFVQKDMLPAENDNPYEKIFQSFKNK